MDVRDVPCSYAQAHLAELLDQVIAERKVVIIRRRGYKDVAMIAADVLEDIGLERAISEGEHSPEVDREEIFRILESPTTEPQ